MEIWLHLLCSSLINFCLLPHLRCISNIEYILWGSKNYIVIIVIGNHILLYYKILITRWSHRQADWWPSHLLYIYWTTNRKSGHLMNIYLADAMSPVYWVVPLWIFIRLMQYHLCTRQPSVFLMQHHSYLASSHMNLMQYEVNLMQWYL